MAGIRHHILPRFLLKGFASRIDGQKVFTWVYRRQGNPFEASTKDISVEKHFYGKDGELNVDPEITDLEKRYASLIDELRTRDDQTEILGSQVPEFIAHLSIRTKHLRDSLRDSANFLIEKIDEHFSDFNNVKALIKKNPRIFREKIEKQLKNYPIPRHQKNHFFYLAYSLAPSLLEEHRPELQMMFQLLIARIKDMLPSALKKGHIKALAKTPVPEPRVEDYRSLRWLITKSDKSLILGDFGCLFEIEGTRRFKTLNDKGDQIKSIFLPISANRMLVGTSLLTVPRIDADLINQATAKCCRDFFVSSEPPPQFDTLTLLIGEDSQVITKEELEQLFAELKDEKITPKDNGIKKPLSGKRKEKKRKGRR